MNCSIVWGMKIREALCAWNRKMFVEGNARSDLHLFLLTIFVFTFMVLVIKNNKIGSFFRKG